MFRKLFQSPSAGVEIAGSHDESLDALAGNINRSQAREFETPPKVAGLGKFESFEDIYRSGPANQPTLAYDIMKVAQMLESPHIATLSAESKRGSLMMALEAAGVEPKDILQDAMVRQRALSDYEEAQQKKMRDFESHKAELNREIQEELDQINGEYLARIQANVNEIAKQQDALRAWQKSKQRELAMMAEACSYLAPPDAAANNLAAALDRAARR
jgi:predicted ATP-binding protein involved in virulence